MGIEKAREDIRRVIKNETTAKNLDKNVRVIELLAIIQSTLDNLAEPDEKIKFDNKVDTLRVLGSKERKQIRELIDSIKLWRTVYPNRPSRLSYRVDGVNMFLEGNSSHCDYNKRVIKLKQLIFGKNDENDTVKRHSV